MAPQRTPDQKANDALRVFNLLRDEVTPPIMREVMQDMTNAERQAGANTTGDVQAYAALVQASLSLQRVIAANDRMTMMAAAILTSSGVTRPVIEEEL
jgi:hypothetical protein